MRRALLQSDRGLRLLWLSRKPRAVVRTAGLCLVMDKMPPSGGLRLRAPKFPADGLLRACPCRPRCPESRRRGAPGRPPRTHLGQLTLTALQRPVGAELGLSADRLLSAGLGRHPGAGEGTPGPSQ